MIWKINVSFLIFFIPPLWRGRDVFACLSLVWRLGLNCLWEWHPVFTQLSQLLCSLMRTTLLTSFSRAFVLIVFHVNTLTKRESKHHWFGYPTVAIPLVCSSYYLQFDKLHNVLMIMLRLSCIHLRDRVSLIATQVSPEAYQSQLDLRWLRLFVWSGSHLVGSIPILGTSRFFG